MTDPLDRHGSFHRPGIDRWQRAVGNHMLAPSEGGTMLDRAGIGVEDLAWIHRDQFDHYLTLARATNDPTDWPSFRLAARHALAAAFGLAGDEPGLDAALAVVDLARYAHDPAHEWDAFLAHLWLRRRSIRPDLD